MILKGTVPTSPVFWWMWQSLVGGKHKFFFWLLLKDRLNTKNLLRCKNMHLDEYTCVLCQQNLEETIEHLFFGCPFNIQCWQVFGIHCDITVSLVEMIVQARHDFGLQIFRKWLYFPLGVSGLIEMQLYLMELPLAWMPGHNLSRMSYLWFFIGPNHPWNRSLILGFIIHLHSIFLVRISIWAWGLVPCIYKHF